MSQGEWITRGVPAIVISQADFKKYSAANGTYRGRFLLDLDRIEIAATLPLQAGAEYVEPRRRITIDRIIPQARAVSIRLRQCDGVDACFMPSLFRSCRSICETAPPPTQSRGRPAGPGPCRWACRSPRCSAWVMRRPSSSGFNVTGEYVRFPGYSRAGR